MAEQGDRVKSIVIGRLTQSRRRPDGRVVMALAVVGQKRVKRTAARGWLMSAPSPFQPCCAGPRRRPGRSPTARWGAAPQSLRQEPPLSEPYSQCLVPWGLQGVSSGSVFRPETKELAKAPGPFQRSQLSQPPRATLQLCLAERKVSERTVVRCRELNDRREWQTIIRSGRCDGSLLKQTGRGGDSTAFAVVRPRKTGLFINWLLLLF
jgi:hypothetical protein